MMHPWGFLARLPCHDVKTRLINADVPTPRANYIVGHARRKVGDRYVHHPIPELVKAISKLPGA